MFEDLFGDVIKGMDTITENKEEEKPEWDPEWDTGRSSDNHWSTGQKPDIWGI